MNDMTEQERDAATIVAEWRAELGTHDREAQDGDRTWHFTHYIRADPEAFIRAALSELDRLQADNARLREQVDAIVAWAESCDDSANNPDLDADVAHDRKESAQDIFRLLGIEAHK